MSANVNSEVTILKRQGKGGIMGAIKRMLARESFFMATYTTTDGQPGEVGLAPTHQGEGDRPTKGRRRRGAAPRSFVVQRILRPIATRHAALPRDARGATE